VTRHLTQTVTFAFLRVQVSVKKLLARAIGLDKVVRIFEKIEKKR
jgi:hypothetical protein